MNREERRRCKKQKAKSMIPAPMNVTNYTVEQISKTTGARIESLRAWQEAYKKEIALIYQKESQEKLWEAEDKTAFINLLGAIYAVKMSRKKGERTKSLVKRMVENINKAMDYVDEIGIERAYKEAVQEFELDDFEFNDFDVRKEFGFEEEA